MLMGAMGVSVAILTLLNWPRPYADNWIATLVVLLLLSFTIAVIERIADWVLQ